MTDYLKYTFTDSPEMVSTFDEQPLWSAAFGLLLFKHLELKPNLTAVDIGSGAGFPLLELAERLGPSSRCYGVDPWHNANSRAKQKIKDYGLSHVQIIEESAEQLPFDDGTVDLIVSNLGINNFANPDRIFKECRRVLKTGGRLALTTNMNGHWQQFYDVFEGTLRELNKDGIIPALTAHQEHRGNAKSIARLFTANGFTVSKSIEDSFDMKFVDGTALLNHHFVKLGWLASWKELIPAGDHEMFFTHLEANLNKYAVAHQSLTLTVPMLYMEGTADANGLPG
jgi:arsenite methyltransferase